MTKHTTTAAIAALLIATLAVPASAGFLHRNDQIEGSGKLETRDFDLKTFTGLELNGSLDAEITIGDRQKVTVTLDDNLFSNLEMDVEGSTLVIQWDKSCDPDNKSKVVITVARLEAIELNGAGDIDVTGFRGDSFEFRLRGAGDLDIEGEVDDLEITLMGAGDVSAKGLKAKHVDVTVTGVGNAEVTATESIEARVSGVGDIDYWGNPEKERTRVSGLGDIDRK